MMMLAGLDWVAIAAADKVAFVMAGAMFAKLFAAADDAEVDFAMIGVEAVWGA